MVAGAAGLLELISGTGGGRSTSKMRDLLHNRVSVTARHVNDMAALCMVVPTGADSKNNTTLEPLKYGADPNIEEQEDLVALRLLGYPGLTDRISTKVAA